MPEHTLNGTRAEAFDAARMLPPDATPDALRAALDDLLFDPRTRETARLAAATLAGDGGERAVDELERLLRRRRSRWDRVFPGDLRGERRPAR